MPVSFRSRFHRPAGTCQDTRFINYLIGVSVGTGVAPQPSIKQSATAGSAARSPEDKKSISNELITYRACVEASHCQNPLPRSHTVHCRRSSKAELPQLWCVVIANSSCTQHVVSGNANNVNWEGHYSARHCLQLSSALQRTKECSAVQCCDAPGQFPAVAPSAQHRLLS
jgi:hypothetical protein